MTRKMIAALEVDGGNFEIHHEDCADFQRKKTDYATALVWEQWWLDETSGEEAKAELLRHNAKPDECPRCGHVTVNDPITVHIHTCVEDAS